MRTALLSLPALLTAGSALAQFQPLRHEDDFAMQRQACTVDNTIACWKHRQITEGVHVSLGGDLRWRHEYVGNPRYGQAPQDRRGAALQRHSAFADLRLGARWRGFAQLGSSLASGRAAGPSPVDANRLDPTNLFVQWHQAVGSGGHIGLRAGIQELQMGSARLIDAREGPNVRRSFDAVHAYAARGDFRVNAFAAAPRDNRPGSFDDARSRTQALRGVYATRTGAGNNWDVYLLHFEDTTGRYAQGIAHERRWTLGARMFGSRGGWGWNWEAALQGGHFGTAGIRAWSLATDTGYTFDDVAWQPRFALLAAIASGDDAPDDDRLGTFNALYPRGNYFGDEATLGPRNFFNIHPSLSLRPAPRIALTASLDLFWRYSVRDGVYAPNGSLLRAPGGSQARYIATIASINARWSPAPGWSSNAVFAWSQPGAFLRETGAHDPLRHIGVTVQYRF
jgi:hypothetical protein